MSHDSRFEALAASAPDAILTIDQQSRILSANPAVERIFGFAPEELVGRALSILIPERLRAAHDAGIARYVGFGRRNIPWTGVQLPGLTKDGREVPVEISFGEFADERGHRVFSGFVRDISERVLQQKVITEREEEPRRLNAELEEHVRAERVLRDQAEAAVRSRDEMLSIVSHDLRNPVSTVAMSAALLKDPTIDLDAAQRLKQLDIIVRSAHRMSRLIHDLLDVARIEGGRFTLQCNCEDVAALATEACEEFRSVVDEKSLDMRCLAGAGLSRMNVDRDRIVQALANFLNNAVKFTPVGGRIVVGVEGAIDGDGIRVFVSDSGPGIDPGELPHLFSRFWQARRTAHLGAGLGLAIASGIARAHEGRVWAESTPGTGSTFNLSVPASRRCV